MGVVIAFGLAGEGEPSYEQFSCLYSVTKSKSADHGGWVQANCLRATKRGHFVSRVPTSQKTWRNQRVLLFGDWESPSDRPVRFSIPTVSQIAGRVTNYRSALCYLRYSNLSMLTVFLCFVLGKVKLPTPSREDIQKVERVRRQVPAADRIYPNFLFTANLIGANLVDPAESEFSWYCCSVGMLPF